MAEIVNFLNVERERKVLHPLLIVGIFTVVFLEIHPLQDGNGRVSRVLTTLLLLRFGYAYVPYSSLESVIEKSKESYYLALRQTQGTIRTDSPNWSPWILFFLRALQKQKQTLSIKIEREKLILAELPVVSAQIMEFVQLHGRITISDAEKLTWTNRNTLKEHFRRLVKNGHLVLNAKGRGAWYRLP